jgi:hypothetical protein
VTIRWLAVVGMGAILLASCSLAEPTDSSTPGASVQADESAQPGTAVVPDGSECPPVRILSPSGTTVDLTGYWLSSHVGVFRVRQRDSCLYWMGMNRDPIRGNGSDWTNVFFGTVRSDFTIVGRYGDVPDPENPNAALGHGPITMRIDFDQSGDVDYPVLRELDATGQVLRQFTWVREESLSEPMDLMGTFGTGLLAGSTCTWIDVNGERYELIGEAALGTGAMPGTPVRVHGQLSAAIGTGCTELAVVVEELDPTP